MEQRSQTDFDRIEMLHKKAERLLKDGFSDDEIIKELTKEGIDPVYAGTILENVGNDSSKRKNFWKLFCVGLFVTIGGLLINYFSYKFATNHHSMFFYIFWGIVATGILMICRAFILFRA